MRSVGGSRVGRSVLTTSLAILLSLSVAHAASAAEVRFLHAVPGGPTAYLQVGGTALGMVGFGEASMYGKASNGKVTLALVSQGKRLALLTHTLEDQRYTVVASLEGKKVVLRIYEDGRARPGVAEVRAVHAVPEADEASFWAGKKGLGVIDKGEATSYATVKPGDYGIAMAAPEGPQGGVMAQAPNTNLAAGTSSSAYLVGSMGEKTRFVVLEDQVAVPVLAPATGLGGLAGEDHTWLAALLAALGAGALGASVYLRATAGHGRSSI